MTRTLARPARDRHTGAGEPENMARLLASCRDRPGIVSAVTAFLHRRGANIVQYDQETTDPVGGRFFQRLVFHLPDLSAALPALER
jgi:formyltetrahydrofolate deformylase